jgi:hypothetical protein
MRLLSLVALAACGSLGVVATAAIAKDPPEDKVVCKRQQDADTGSHFATTKRVCLKKSEWKQMEEGAENSLRRVREQGGACPKCLSPSTSRSGPG